jgi:hypothetical protein
MADGAPKRIYLDTNSLYGWPSPSFNVWNAFRLLKWLKCEICMPEMVELELEGQFMRGIADDRSEIQSRIRSITKRDISIIDVEGGVAMADTEEIREVFRARSETYKAHYQIRVVPLPKTPLNQLAEMAVYRKPPFEERLLDKETKAVTGFADMLILQSILADIQLHTDKSGPFIFVSNDKVFTKSEIKKQFREHGLGLVANPFALSDEILPFLKAAIRDPWTQEMKEIHANLNAQIQSLSMDVHDCLFTSDVIDTLWPNSAELDNFRLLRFQHAHTDLPASECLPPTVPNYCRPEGSEVNISTRAEISMTGVSVLPNYLSGIFGSETDSEGRRVFQATIDVSLTGTVANGRIGNFKVKDVSR